MSSKRLFFWIAGVLAWMPGLGMASETRGASRFKDVGVELRWQWAGNDLIFGRAAGKDGMAVSRADFLMSGLALRRADGTWLESDGWHACFRGSDGLNGAVLEGVPAQVFSGIRFQVGVEAEVDRSDPNHWPAGHALHPLVNGLHWGWQGGYIFMALEGRYPRPGGAAGGFSYHLAGSARRMTVTLEGALDVTAGGTIGIDFDVAKVLGGLNPAEFGESTHSREGDPRADVLRKRVEQAFALGGVVPEMWQAPAVAAGAVSMKSGLPVKPAGTPYPIRISNRLPKAALPADNVPTLEGVELGRKLFHETRLSINNLQSCASCHDRRAAFTDAGKRFSLGAEGVAGTRNAMPLFNLAWQQEFFWDGRAKRLRDQVLVPVSDPVEMHLPLDLAVEKLSGEKRYEAEFEAVFGSGGITAERMGLALEQFLLTLISQDSKFDRALLGRGKLTPVEQRGLELFITEHDPARNLRGADCFHCHGGALFSNQGFANNGLDAAPQPGRRAVTGLAADVGKFRVPSLRNIALTAPYMHDGRFGTLEQVIDHYDHGVHRTDTLDPNLAKHPPAGLQLSPGDKAALVAFLKTLTDTTLTHPHNLPQPISKP